MKRLIDTLWSALSSRATSPVVIGIFLIVYIVIAFGTDETLVALIALTASSLALQLLLALLPASSAARFYLELSRFLKRRRALTGACRELPEGLFDETVEVAGEGSLAGLQGRLEAEGYRTRLSGGTLGAWRGVSTTPARLLFLAGTFCLFAGILISTSSRVVHRQNVVEGEPMPTAKGGGGVVQKIALKPGTGRVLARDLVIQVAASEAGDSTAVFGLYPPSLYRGNFVYPRYLGIAPFVSFSAPDLPAPVGGLYQLGVYPAGKEDRLEFAGTPYRMEVSLAQPADGSDPFVSGKITLLFKLFRDKEPVLSGSAPAGGEFSRDGYRVAVSGFRHLVITDFVKDYGVLLIWCSGVLFTLCALFWLPVRICAPRREMGFLAGGGRTLAFSRAEGGARRHGGVFHELLDLLDSPAAARPAQQGEDGKMAGV